MHHRPRDRSTHHEEGGIERRREEEKKGPEAAGKIAERTVCAPHEIARA